MTKRALIIDDEANCRANLNDLLLKYCSQVEVIGMAENIEKGLQFCRCNEPDLIFLDINMPDGSGFDFLKQLGSNKADIIFTTAHDDYAVKAFRYAAVDYLLKPIDITELRESVAKCLESGRSGPQNMTAISEQLQNGKFDRLLLAAEQGYVFAEIRKIIYVEAEGNYTRFVLEDQNPILVSKPIGDYSEILTQHNFYRIHHSHMINLHAMRTFNKKDSEVEMNDGTKLLVSGRKKTGFFKYCQYLAGQG